MENGLLVAAIAAATLLLLRKKNSSGTGAMSDDPVSLKNLRMGIKRGWYQAELTRRNGQPAVVLSGKQTDGTYTSDVYPVDEATWQALKQDGVKEV